MKITRYLMASSAVALSLLMATPALAHSGVSANASVNGDNNPGLHLGSALRVSNDNDGDRDDQDKDDNRGNNADKKERKALGQRAFLSAISAEGAGVVTSVSGSTFTLKSRASGTTAVTTNASTTYKVNGVATTSSALGVGSRVIVFGSTDSSGGITATLVSILDVGIRFFAHIFH